ncbi:Putative FAD-containing monooxygenase MymA [BD1-7 clade bacterium]|nr:Putative FAD-containing monooxygenase MymA [BD1-7 clade bacterium]
MNNTADIIIIGAGLSGIGAACHFKRHCPGKRVRILEARENMGGTWDLFRYPGIRSDSDMFTLGYNFKPWTDSKAIADGESILEYIRETAKEHRIDESIEYGCKVRAMNWCSRSSRWTLTVDTDEGPQEYQSQFVLSCTGYYDYEAGYEPAYPEKDVYQGQFIHPQFWPEDFDYAGKKVVVIGSGATAVTIVPAMADKAAQVTMLQRSPSYMIAMPTEDKMLNGLYRFLPEKLAYMLGRGRNILINWLGYKYMRAFPAQGRGFLLKMAKKALPADFDMKHFSPSYNPWDERLCAVTDGDMFEAISQGKVAIETDHIARFVETGIELKSGKVLEADAVVSATGLNLKVMSGIAITVDDQPYDITQKMYYKGILFEDLPNLGMVFGYTNASWTLKSDLISEYFCRLINHMSANGYTQVKPVNSDKSMAWIPFVDMSSGYIKRAESIIPKQGAQYPWRLHQNYVRDLFNSRFGKLVDEQLEFSKATDKPAVEAPELDTANAG